MPLRAGESEVWYFHAIWIFKLAKSGKFEYFFRIIIVFNRSYTNKNKFDNIFNLCVSLRNYKYLIYVIYSIQFKKLFRIYLKNVKIFELLIVTIEHYR